MPDRSICDTWERLWTGQERCASAKGPRRRWSMSYCQRHKQEKPGRAQRHRENNIRIKTRFDGQAQMTVMKVKVTWVRDSSY